MPTNMSIDSEATETGRTNDADVSDSLKDSATSDSRPAGTLADQPPGSQPTDPAMRRAQFGLSTKCVHAGERRQKPEGSITAPIFTAEKAVFSNRMPSSPT